MPSIQHNESESLVSEYNSLGELTGYIDADGNTSTYTYDDEGRLVESYDGKGARTRHYDAYSGDLTKLEDSGVGTFTATYDVEGRLLTETTPNGLKGTHTYDSVGSAIGLSYEKTTHCSKECIWYTDEALSSIHGQWLSQSSTRGSFDYAYDAAGRLIKATDTPVGQGCTTRLYAYDADTNRTSMTTRVPAGGGSCAESGGTVQSHSFNAADRLADEGVEYNSFGDIMAMSAADAGGHALAATYYADDTTASLAQSGVTVAYNLDPSGRQRQIFRAGGEEESEAISHFTGGGDAPAWTDDGSGNWTRYAGGLGGGLGAMQTSGSETQLQIADLHGNIVATVPDNELASGLEFLDEASEWGVPKGSAPKKYSWLGSAQRSTELPTGVISMGARTYVPSLGQFLQTDPVPGGGPNAYAYTWGDPVNQTDLSGAYTPHLPTWALESAENLPYVPPPLPEPEEEVEEEVEEIIESAPGKHKGKGHGVGGRGGPKKLAALRPLSPHNTPEMCEHHPNRKGCSVKCGHGSAGKCPHPCGSGGTVEACPGPKHHHDSDGGGCEILPGEGPVLGRPGAYEECPHDPNLPPCGIFCEPGIIERAPIAFVEGDGSGRIRRQGPSALVAV
jgi:RHS repeat-associated protein